VKDISNKPSTVRTARAIAIVRVGPDLIAHIKNDEVPKGDPRNAAKFAAMLAAKATSQLIPHCHPIPIEHFEIDFELQEDAIVIETSVKTTYKTGAEMEALTAASVAALTIYDILKVFHEDISIESVRLASKTGGKSVQTWRSSRRLTAAVVVTSDSRKEKDDQSGKVIIDRLKSEGFDPIEYKVIADDDVEIFSTIRTLTDENPVNLIVTTGGTGLGPRDNTPDAITRLIEKEVPGISEHIRQFGQARNPLAMLSRARAGIRKSTLIVNLPGSINGVKDGLNAIFPAVLHSFDMMAGQAHAADEDKAKSRPR